MKLHCFSCPWCSISMNSSRCILLIFVSSLLISQTVSYAMPGNGNDSPAAIFSSGKGNRTLALSTSSASSSTYPLGLSLSSDRKQRFCLNRLKDALHVVCSSGSASTMPLYFNPGEYSSVNDTSSVPFNGRGMARSLKNDIPTMAQPQSNRRVIRRRSRRNIVRECCEKPCSYNSLRKYCSTTTTRTTGFHVTNLRADNQPQLSPIAPPPPTQESRVVNEIDETEESDLMSQRVDQSGNIRTLPPILHYVNLPRGTNDDMY